MRVIEPKKSIKKDTTKSSRSKNASKAILIILSILVSVSLYYLFIYDKKDSKDEFTNEVPSVAQDTLPQTREESNEQVKTPAEFNGNEFNALYDNLILKNTEIINQPPALTGNDLADARIRQLAEARGYKIRSVAAGILSSINGYLLQNEVIDSWLSMQQNAKEDGINMIIVSGFRTIEEQKELFLNRLISDSVEIEKISTGFYDELIDEVLSKASPPGYSKHHSGYTFDLRCQETVSRRFKDSICNQWLTENNYENAREFGFIPSFPVDADIQGPDPEAWEYVYVGTEVLNPN